MNIWGDISSVPLCPIEGSITWKSSCIYDTGLLVSIKKSGVYDFVLSRYDASRDTAPEIRIIDASVYGGDAPYFVDFFRGLVTQVVNYMPDCQMISLYGEREWVDDDGNTIPKNGYYSWARLWFELSSRVDIRALQQKTAWRTNALLEYDNMTYLQQLLRTQQWREWWRKNGWSAEMHFDPHDARYTDILEWYYHDRLYADGGSPSKSLLSLSEESIYRL